jgi:hypothetical protein
MDYECTIKITSRIEGIKTYKVVVDADSKSQARRTARWNARHSGAFMPHDQITVPKVELLVD